MLRAPTKTIFGLNGPYAFCTEHETKRNKKKRKAQIVNNEKAKKLRKVEKRDVGKCMLCYNNFITSLSFFALSKLFRCREWDAKAYLNFYLPPWKLLGGEKYDS